VDVLVPHRFVSMAMRMRLRRGSMVYVFVMLVVYMAVLVLDRLVKMFVLVPLREVQPVKTHKARAPQNQYGQRTEHELSFTARLSRAYLAWAPQAPAHDLPGPLPRSMRRPRPHGTVLAPCRP
jgi:hypothetical protein